MYGGAVELIVQSTYRSLLLPITSFKRALTYIPSNDTLRSLSNGI